MIYGDLIWILLIGHGLVEIRRLTIFPVISSKMSLGQEGAHWRRMIAQSLFYICSEVSASKTIDVVETDG